MLRECLRVLKSGRVLRLVVPDLELLVRDYVQASSNSGQSAQKELPADAFVHHLLMVRDAVPRGIVDRWLKPVLGKHTIHCWACDWSSLRARFVEARFTIVRRCSYLEGAIPNIADLDLAERVEESPYVEAVKP